MTPIRPLLPVQTGSQSLLLKKIISQQPQEVNSQFLYRSLILKKVFTKRWPQLDLYFLSKPEVKVEYLKKNHISTTARGKFTIFAPLYRSLIVKTYLQKSDPNLTFTSGPNWKSKFNINTIISQQPQEVHFQFLNHCTDR